MVITYTTNPLLADTDNGFTDGEEVANGTDRWCQMVPLLRRQPVTPIHSPAATPAATEVAACDSMCRGDVELRDAINQANSNLVPMSH
jgi:hypothetical protein